MERVRVDRATLQPYQRGPSAFRGTAFQGHRFSGACGFPGACGQPPGQVVETTTTMVRPILILSPFFSRWAAYMRRLLSQVPLVEPRVLDEPVAVGQLEQGVVAGGVLVVDDQAALPAGGELAMEGADLVTSLDDDRMRGGRLGQG